MGEINLKKKGNEQKLERLQNRALRIILSTSRKTCSQDMRNKLGLLSLCSRRRFFTFTDGF